MHDALFASSSAEVPSVRVRPFFMRARAGNSRVNSYLKDTKLVLSVSKNAMVLHLNETQSRKMRAVERCWSELREGFFALLMEKRVSVMTMTKLFMGACRFILFDLDWSIERQHCLPLHPAIKFNDIFDCILTIEANGIQILMTFVDFSLHLC